jgi:hypothetical protein
LLLFLYSGEEYRVQQRANNIFLAQFSSIDELTRSNVEKRGATAGTASFPPIETGATASQSENDQQH